jgi:hypothetical protein
MCHILVHFSLLRTLGLSLSSIGLLVGSWLICTQPPCLVIFQCKFRGSVEAWTEIILYQFEGQTHFGMPRGANVSLTLSDPNSLLYI